jgi:hypothetical protein
MDARTRSRPGLSVVDGVAVLVGVVVGFGVWLGRSVAVAGTPVGVLVGIKTAAWTVALGSVKVCVGVGVLAGRKASSPLTSSGLSAASSAPAKISAATSSCQGKRRLRG